MRSIEYFLVAACVTYNLSIAAGKVRVLYDYVATEKNALSLRAGELATLIEACRPLVIFVFVIPIPFRPTFGSRVCC